jgi:hypothetical protein
MSTKKLHIIAFDNPFPPDYGGAVDMYYKIGALRDAGIRITLHVFEYGRNVHGDIAQQCDAVYYYPRMKWVNPFLCLPYIVASRNSKLLLRRLLQDDAPILFEGIHTCYWLLHPLLSHRVKLVRMHNIEHDYYRQLAKVEARILKRAYFHLEAMLLKRFYPKLKAANHILAISANDYETLSRDFNTTTLVGPFHAHKAVKCATGKGQFVLYHGNLAVSENDEAARFLVNEVFSKLDVPFVIAGNSPSLSLQKDVERYPHIELKSSISTAEIDQLIEDAHIHILPTFQPTGIKLKLIHVMFSGRFVVANSNMVKNTGCEPYCTVADAPTEMQNAIMRLMKRKFTEQDAEERARGLSELFSTRRQASIIAGLI